MGYFSNGTEGCNYQADYCFRCVHFVDENDGRGPGCPIWDAHLLHAYEECGKKSAGEDILNMLIPRSKNRLGNDQCLLFISADGSLPGQLKLLSEGQ